MSFKVTDFSTNGKLIYGFLLVININLPPILHCFRVMVKFSLAREECLTLMFLLGVIASQYRYKCNFAKTRFLLQKALVYLQLLLSNPPPKVTEFGEITLGLGLLRRSRSSKVTEFHTNRKFICDFLLEILNNYIILHRFRDMAFDRSKIAIFS